MFRSACFVVDHRHTLSSRKLFSKRQLEGTTSISRVRRRRYNNNHTTSTEQQRGRCGVPHAIEHICTKRNSYAAASPLHSALFPRYFGALDEAGLVDRPDAWYLQRCRAELESRLGIHVLRAISWICALPSSLPFCSLCDSHQIIPITFHEPGPQLLISRLLLVVTDKATNSNVSKVRLRHSPVQVLQGDLCVWIAF